MFTETQRYNGAHQESSAHALNEQLIEVLQKEAAALAFVVEHFPANAYQCISKIITTSGRIVFSGHGKSGLVARKLVATFSSVGIPSLFLHPGDALHGDIGMIQPHDLCIVLSKSGASTEFEYIIPLLRSFGNEVILICCNEGALYSLVDLAIVLPFQQEACQFNLAPTSSSTVMIAFGDALAIVSSKLRGFTRNDFAKLHPSGSLGRSLLLTVKSLMHDITNFQLIRTNASFQEVLGSITRGKKGIGVVVDENLRLQGVITDGDLRRACEKGAAVFSYTAFEIMTHTPKTVTENISVYEALVTMKTFSITNLIVISNEKITGILHIHDILRAGISV